MKYRSTPLPEQPFVQREFQRVQEALETVHQFDVLHVEPAKPRVGLVAYADGTDWDPDSGGAHGGEGLYVYTSAGWKKLNDYGST